MKELVKFYFETAMSDVWFVQLFTWKPIKLNRIYWLEGTMDTEIRLGVLKSNVCIRYLYVAIKIYYVVRLKNSSLTLKLKKSFQLFVCVGVVLVKLNNKCIWWNLVVVIVNIGWNSTGLILWHSISSFPL